MKGYFRSIAGVTMALWLGAVLMTGAAAAIAFPEMRELGPVLPAFAGHEPEHWSIAAGHVMLPIFGVLDYATLALSGLAVVFTGLSIRSCAGRAGIALWLVGLIGATALGGHHALVRSPEMREDAHAYWEAAREGDEETAARRRVEFETAHPVASNILKAESGLLFLGVVGWSLTRTRDGETATEAA